MDKPLVVFKETVFGVPLTTTLEDHRTRQLPTLNPIHGSFMFWQGCSAWVNILLFSFHHLHQSYPDQCSWWNQSFLLPTKRQRKIQRDKLYHLQPDVSHSSSRTVLLLQLHFLQPNRSLPRYISSNPGFKNGVLYGSTDYLFKDESKFMSVYAGVFAAQFLICITYLIMIGCNESIPYNRVLNPITIFGVATFIFFLMVRISSATIR